MLYPPRVLKSVLSFDFLLFCYYKINPIHETFITSEDGICGNLNLLSHTLGKFRYRLSLILSLFIGELCFHIDNFVGRGKWFLLLKLVAPV